jgi:hypothetical protein
MLPNAGIIGLASLMRVEVLEKMPEADPSAYWRRRRFRFESLELVIARASA